MDKNKKKEWTNLIEIGSEINIEISAFTDDLPEKLIKKIKKDPKGIVIDYKMTDGNGVGLIIKRNDGLKLWLFKNEIKGYKVNNKENDAQENNLLNIRNSLINQKCISSSKSLSSMFNPFNFIKWFLYTTKDII